jgi:hypothetical protein
MRKKRGLFILILMVTCFVLLMEAGEKAVNVKIILDQNETPPAYYLCVYPLYFR